MGEREEEVRDPYLSSVQSPFPTEATQIVKGRKGKKIEWLQIEE